MSGSAPGSKKARRLPWMGAAGVAAAAAAAGLIAGCRARATAEPARLMFDAAAPADAAGMDGAADGTEGRPEGRPDTAGDAAPEAGAFGEPRFAALVAADGGYGVLWSSVQGGTARVWFSRLAADGARLGPDLLLHGEAYGGADFSGVSALNVTPTSLVFTGAQYGLVHFEGTGPTVRAIVFRRLDSGGSELGAPARVAADGARNVFLGWQNDVFAVVVAGGPQGWRFATFDSGGHRGVDRVLPPRMHLGDAVDGAAAHDALAFVTSGASGHWLHRLSIDGRWVGAPALVQLPGGPVKVTQVLPAADEGAILVMTAPGLDPDSTREVSIRLRRVAADGATAGEDIIVAPRTAWVATHARAAASPEGLGALWLSYGPQRSGSNDVPMFARVRAGPPGAVIGRCTVLSPPLAGSAAPGLLGVVWNATERRYAVLVGAQRLDPGPRQHLFTLRTFGPDDCATSGP